MPPSLRRAEAGSTAAPARISGARPGSGSSRTDRVQCCVSVRQRSNRRSRRVLKASLSIVAGTGVAMAAAAAAPAALPPERSFDAGRAHLFYKMAASSYCPTPDVLAWDCPPCRATNLSAAVAPRIFTEVLTGAETFSPKPEPDARPQSACSSSSPARSPTLTLSEPYPNPTLNPTLNPTPTRCARLRRRLRRGRSHVGAELPRL